MKSMVASSYSEKLERLDRCARLQKVDRVPIAAATLYFPADRKSTRLNSSHITRSRMPSSA